MRRRLLKQPLRPSIAASCQERDQRIRGIHESNSKIAWLGTTSVGALSSPLCRSGRAVGSFIGVLRPGALISIVPRKELRRMKLKTSFVALSFSALLAVPLAAQMTATTSTATSADSTGTKHITTVQTKTKHTTTTATHVKKHPKKIVKKTTTYKLDPPSVEVKVKPH
jgi:hypothetical protein